MLPSLHLFDRVALPSYGLMLFISFLFGIVLFQRRVTRRRLLPATLRYNWAWLLTDVALALIMLGAAIWAVFFAAQQWPFLKERPATVIWLFRLLAFALGAYSIYGSIQHIQLHGKSKEIESAEFVHFLAIWVLFSAIIGSRLLYVAFHWSEFARDLVGTFAFWRGGLQGLMFYGGLIGALVMGVAFAQINRVPLLKLLDAAMPSILLGEFFTRIGCFLNGCCFGRPCNLPWAVHYPVNAPISTTEIWQQGVHPTPLYSSLAGLLMFGIALRLERQGLRTGRLFGVMLVIYAGFRFGIDFVRYYENAANFWINQGISLGLAAIGVAVIIHVAHKGTADERG
jgi:phosphatidylglycerol:prolipoprotein diacylglycerol transferase